MSHAVYVFTGEIGIMFLPPVSSEIPKNSQEVSKLDRNMALLMTCFVIVFAASQPCQTPDDLVAADSPGHIMIGGLFAIHEKILSSEEYPESQKSRSVPGV